MIFKRKATVLNRRDPWIPGNVSPSLSWKQLYLQGGTMGSPVDFEEMRRFVRDHAIGPMFGCTFSLNEVNGTFAEMHSSP